jgi:hypothetical protein
MTDADKKDLILSYQKKKAAGKLSDNLSNPSPGKLRNECLIVYKERYTLRNEDTLRLFFEKDKEGDYSESIEKLDIDKFRPLVYLLIGKTESPNDKHYRLLAWLIGLEDKGDTVKTAPKKPAKPVTIRKAVIVLIIIVLGGSGTYLYKKSIQGCMYWTGDHYQPIPCNQKVGDTAIIAFDEQKTVHLKKITRPDTITTNALGRVWYVKIDKRIEYYTAGGFHPIEYKRKLKPITGYIIGKYIIHK